MKETGRNKSVPLAVVYEELRQRHIQFTAVDCSAICENCGAHSDPKKQKHVHRNNDSGNQQWLCCVPETNALANWWPRTLDAIDAMRPHMNLRQALVAGRATTPCAMTTSCGVWVPGAIFENWWGKRHQRGAASAAARLVRYQATVAARPSRNFMAAFHPSNCSARVASMRLRGWPSGFVASH